MYIFVNFMEKEKYYREGHSNAREKVRIEKASGKRCLVVPYREFNTSVAGELKPEAVVMGGFANTGRPESYLGVIDFLKTAHIPVICFCGSHQLIGGYSTHNFASISKWSPAPMRKLKKNEDVPRMPKTENFDSPEHFVACGFYNIRKLKNDPLFKGLPNPMIMKCSHYCEIKQLPSGFELLAESGHCKIEAIKDKKRILYGTQFHPEAYEAPFFNGRTLLENFADIVRNFWQTKKRTRTDSKTS